ncbi:hypothetical protein BDQ17DRAFT_1348680 [Cyathus striatus]|nr:hypothetical protein BDQ17DRAFT_1348680 [Cyathus striatus]
MAHSHNSRVHMDPMQANSVLLHNTPQLFPQHLLNRPSQSSSTVCSLPSFALLDAKYGESDDPQAVALPPCLLSPPPTNSDPKHSIPLPALPFPSSIEPLEMMCFPHSWTILDSPLVTRISKQQAPPSPPPTEPLSATELPPETDDLSHVFTGTFDQDDVLIGPSSRRHPSSPGTPLSPISPDLGTSRIATIPSPPGFEHGYLLRHSPPQDEHQHEFYSQNGLFNYSDGYDDHRLLAFSPPGDNWHFDDDVSSYDASRSDFMDIDSNSPNSYPSQLGSQDMHHQDASESPSPPYPSSPLIQNHPSLPSLDDDLDLFHSERDNDDMVLSSPSSPSLRHRFSSLPEIEEDLPMHPFSPSIPSLSLPEAADDSEIFSPPDTFDRSLLLDDFDGDTIPPRSPSPDIFTIDPALLQDADPELTGLYELQHKAQAAEKAARARESSILEEEGNGPAAAEARRAVKREKAKVKELQNLLRLKLRYRDRDVGKDDFSSLGIIDEDGHSPSPKKKSKSSKPKISSIPQLVANMLLSRYEPKPMSGRRPLMFPSSSSVPKKHSPLVREDDGDELDLDQLGLVDFGDLGVSMGGSGEEVWSDADRALSPVLEPHGLSSTCESALVSLDGSSPSSGSGSDS